MNINLSAIKRIDINNFEQIFRNFYSPLCIYANSFVRNNNVSEEIVQEIFYNLWKKRKTFQLKLSLKSYLYRAVQNNSLLYLQHLKVEDKYIDFVKNDLSVYHSNPEKELEFSELSNIIEDTLNSLSERSATIFQMSRYEGLKYEEIASKLQISIKTVESNISKVLKILRTNILNQ